jgi:hypothetical protein
VNNDPKLFNVTRSKNIEWGGWKNAVSFPKLTPGRERESFDKAFRKTLTE